MELALPRFVSLKSDYNNKYLSYVHEEKEPHAFLQYSGENIVSNPHLKFEIEPAETVDGTSLLVHIRCCYNHKYLVAGPSIWITATAEAPEEDRSKPSCTLFKPQCVDVDVMSYRFLLVHQRRYASVWKEPTEGHLRLYTGDKENFFDFRDSTDLCTVVDCNSLVIMPKHVAFNGDNGKYLIPYAVAGGKWCLQFASDNNQVPEVETDIVPAGDGSVFIKSKHAEFKEGRYWRHESDNNEWDWIFLDDKNTADRNDKEMLFWPVKIDDTTIGLRCLSNNKYCKRLTAGIDDCLSACETNDVRYLSKWARLQVEELISSREIYNIRYRLKDCKLYNKTAGVISNSRAINDSDKENQIELKVAFKSTSASAWKIGASLKLGTKVTMEVGVVPLFVGGKLELSGEVQGSIEYGEVKTKEHQIDAVYKVRVPPMTKVSLNVIAKRATCDVPFSYYQHDSLLNGKHRIAGFEDGIYTSINDYSFDYQTTYEKLQTVNPTPDHHM